MVLFFISGIIFSYFVSINFAFLSISIFLLLFLALLSLKKRLLSAFFLLCTIFSLGALGYQNSKIIPPNSIFRFISEGRAQVWIKARLCSQIDTLYLSAYKKKLAFILRVLAVENKGVWQSVSGKVRATLFMEQPDFEFGDTLVLKGEILQPQGALQTRDFNYKEYLARQGIYGIFQIKPETIKIVCQSRNILRYVFRLKDKFRGIINKTLPYPHQAILSALILGDRQGIPRIIKESFSKTGTVHILAISGLHVGLISYIFFLFLKILRIPYHTSCWVLIFLINAYALLTGANAPVVRAALMATVYLAGLLLRREGNILNTLALSCLLILIFNPQQLFNAGFQLSFLSVLSIITLTPLLESYLMPGYLKTSGKANRWILFREKAKRYVVRAIAVSLSAWLGVVPIVGYYFRLITPITILANLLVIPLAFLILAIGFITLLCGFFSLGLAHLFAYTNLLAINSLINITTALNKIPFGALPTKNFSLPAVFIYYFILTVVFLSVKRKNFYP